MKSILLQICGKRRFVLLLATVCTFVFIINSLSSVSFAKDTEATGGKIADTLTINVGYYGGPYYEKHVFTLNELNSLPQVREDYTFIDSMPAVVIDHVQGVRLADIVEAAGIDLGSVATFYFWTVDKNSDYYTSFKKTELIDKARYCYKSLPENFDSELGKGNEYAASVKERVDTVISLADDWNRCIAGAEFGSDFMNLDTSTRFRLIFGQINTEEQTASRSAKWIHSINIELGGAPVITLDKANIDGEIGSVLKTSASIKAADSVIAQSMEIEWSSSDESIATVDSSGNVTIHGEGTAVITAQAGGASASMTVNGTSGEKTITKAVEGIQGNDIGEKSGKNDIPIEPLADIGEQEALNYEIVKKQTDAVSEDTAGGVQNWRIYEMSETAESLADVDEDNPLVPVMGGGAAGLFAAAFVFKTVRFRLQIR